MAVELDDLKIKPEPAKMSLIGPLPGEAPPTTRGQDIAIGATKALLPDPTNVAEITQEFTELASDVWRAKNPYRGGAWYATKKLVQNSPEAARALRMTKEAISPYIQRGKEFLQKDRLEPVYAGIENLTGIKRRVADPAQPLMIKGDKTSSRIDPDEMVRRSTLDSPGFKLNRKELRQEIVRLQDEGMDLIEAKKHLLGDEDMWIDNLTGEPISIQKNTKDPSKPRFIGWWSRGKRGSKRTLLTEQQSLGPGETAFTKYNATTNKVELAVKKGDEIHHWNSIIDKSSAYTDLSVEEAKELTGLVRESGWMFGDNKANLIKMIRSDHKKIHKFMRENGIEGLTARKTMEKLYKGKSVKERFEILRGFMENVQGAVDEELIEMGYKMPKAHAAAQAANRKLLKIGK